MVLTDVCTYVGLSAQILKTLLIKNWCSLVWVSLELSDQILAIFYNLELFEYFYCVVFLLSISTQSLLSFGQKLKQYLFEPWAHLRNFVSRAIQMFALLLLKLNYYYYSMRNSCVKEIPIRHGANAVRASLSHWQRCRVGNVSIIRGFVYPRVR